MVKVPINPAPFGLKDIVNENDPTTPIAVNYGASDVVGNNAAGAVTTVDGGPATGPAGAPGDVLLRVSDPATAVAPGDKQGFRTVARFGPTGCVGVQGNPNAQTVAVNLAAANLLTRLIIGNHAAGANQDYTLPTGAQMDAAIPVAEINQAFEWSLINTSPAAADSITIVAAAGHTVEGNGLVASPGAVVDGGSGRFLSRRTAVGTWITYRIA